MGYKRYGYIGLNAASIVFLLLSAVTLILIPFRFKSLAVDPGVSRLPNYVSLALKPVNSYLNDLKSHALFYVPQVKVAVIEKGPDPGAIFENYRLIGIVQGAQPAAVVQDITKKITHLVKPGETFNQIEVLKVGSGNVLLTYNGIEKNLELEEAVQ